MTPAKPDEPTSRTSGLPFHMSPTGRAGPPVWKLDTSVRDAITATGASPATAAGAVPGGMAAGLVVGTRRPWRRRAAMLAVDSATSAVPSAVSVLVDLAMPRR